MMLSQIIPTIRYRMSDFIYKYTPLTRDFWWWMNHIPREDRWTAVLGLIVEIVLMPMRVSVLLIALVILALVLILMTLYASITSISDTLGLGS